MPMSLHEATIPGFLQTIGAVRGLLDNVDSHVASGASGEEELLSARLAPDMLPFSYQVKSVWTHSALAVERCFDGRFSPHMDPPPRSVGDLRALLDQGVQSLRAVSPEALEDIAERPMVFTIGEALRLDFTVQNFLLSFSQPNCHFHAATAYALLRMQGLPIGKRDYMGQMRVGLPG